MRKLKLSEKLSILYRLLRFSKNPNSYHHVEMFRRSIKRAGFVTDAVAKLKRDPTTARVFEKQELFEENRINLPALKKLPTGSFGRTWVEFLEANHLNLVYFSATENRVTDEETFYVRRVLQTHDMWHVLLGYNTSELDEIRLQAFMYRQMHWPTAPFVIAGYLFRTAFTDPARTPEALRAVAEGWNHAGQVPDMIAIPLENYLNGDLEKVRENLGIVVRSP